MIETYEVSRFIQYNKRSNAQSTITWQCQWINWIIVLEKKTQLNRCITYWLRRLSLIKRHRYMLKNSRTISGQKFMTSQHYSPTADVCWILESERYPLSGADSIGHGARVPNFYKWQGTGARYTWVEEQQTRNWPNCTDHHENAHQKND